MKEYEKKVKQYLQERGWDALCPADLAKSVSIEAAELLELFQWKNDSLAEVKKNAELMQQIRGELADVMIYCFDMAVLLGIDTKQILEEKLRKIREKYPAHLFNKKKNSAEPGSEEIYWKIKKEHRRKNNK